VVSLAHLLRRAGSNLDCFDDAQIGKWVYLFEEGSGDDKSLLGGKGAGLCEMTRAGLPVPPGLIVTTEACNAFFDNDKSFPKACGSRSRKACRRSKEKVGKKFGDPKNPLLVSVRSGAAFSMPGMMDTVLNLGLNEETVQGLAAQTGDLRFALDAYRRFASLFGEIVMGVAHEKFERVMDRYKAQTPAAAIPISKPEHLRDIIAAEKQIIVAEQHAIPEDPYEQLRVAIAAVFNSWMGRRAIDYRRVNRIPDSLGTAVNVQAMVFGNMGEGSGTGVAFTRNPSTGKKELYGEYLLERAGRRRGRRHSHAESDQPTEERAAESLRRVRLNHRPAGKALPRHAGLRVHDRARQALDAANAHRQTQRRGRSARRGGDGYEKLIDRATAVQRVTPEQLDQLLHPTVDPKTKATVLATGCRRVPARRRAGCFQS
jgi:pyruvate,orthophosphate dikinase